MHKVIPNRESLRSPFSSKCFPASTQGADQRSILGRSHIRQFFSDANPTKTINGVVSRYSSRDLRNTKLRRNSALMRMGWKDLMLQPPRVSTIIPLEVRAFRSFLANKDVTPVKIACVFMVQPMIIIILPAKVTPGQYKVHWQRSWSAGAPVDLLAERIMGSSRDRTDTGNNHDLFPQTNPRHSDAPKPKSGTRNLCDARESCRGR